MLAYAPLPTISEKFNFIAFCIAISYEIFKLNGYQKLHHSQIFQDFKRFLPYYYIRYHILSCTSAYSTRSDLIICISNWVNLIAWQENVFSVSLKYSNASFIQIQLPNKKKQDLKFLSMSRNQKRTHSYTKKLCDVRTEGHPF